MRTAEQAAAYAIERANSGEEMAASGYCLQFVRECYPIASYYYSAIDAWNAAEIKHPGGSALAAPPGFPCFFYSSSIYDHVVISVGSGNFASVWNEEIRILSEATVLGTFGPFIGFSEDLNRVRIYSDAGNGGGGGVAEEDDMRLIRRGSTGTTSLIGDGWYLPLGENSISAFMNMGLSRVALATADYDTVLACLVQGTTAIWEAKVSRGDQTVKALQELADSKTYSMQADATLDGIVAAFRNVPGVDGAALVADVESRRAKVAAARWDPDDDELEWPSTGEDPR